MSKKQAAFHVDQTKGSENGHRLEACVRMACINHVTLAQELQAIHGLSLKIVRTVN